MTTESRPRRRSQLRSRRRGPRGTPPARPQRAARPPGSSGWGRRRARRAGRRCRTRGCRRSGRRARRVGPSVDQRLELGLGHRVRVLGRPGAGAVEQVGGIAEAGRSARCAAEASGAWTLRSDAVGRPSGHDQQPGEPVRTSRRAATASWRRKTDVLYAGSRPTSAQWTSSTSTCADLVGTEARQVAGVGVLRDQPRASSGAAADQPRSAWIGGGRTARQKPTCCPVGTSSSSTSGGRRCSALLQPLAAFGRRAGTERRRPSCSRSYRGGSRCRASRPPPLSTVHVVAILASRPGWR